MDAESDDSERWEDFYGSTTELAPALLSIYDALNTSLENSYNNNNNNNEGIYKSQHNSTTNSILLAEESIRSTQKDKNLYNSPRSTRRSLQQSPAVNKSTCRNRQSEAMSNTKQRNNIRLLSPNVQRIIAHSDAEHVDSINMDTLQQQLVENESCSSPTATVQHYRKKPNSSTLSSHVHKGKLSLIPLSKGAEKLTMSGNELVSTFDSSTEYLDTLAFAQNQTLIAALKHVSNSDDEKTPTNTHKPFTFDLPQSKDVIDGRDDNSAMSLPCINLMEMKQLATTTQLLSTLTMSPSPPKTPDHSTPLVKEGMNPEKAFSIVCEPSQRKVEAVNTSLVNKKLYSNTNKTKSRSQSLIHPRTLKKDLSLHNSAPLKTTASKSVPALENPENGSTESLDLLTEMKSKFPTKEPQKMNSLLLPEISKLKHRPLSSSSLCSTTSSSSSGSDNLNSKLSTSYLASIESLADHSESELAVQHVNMSVLDRSCLEIVDSERNYVEDLRQVITGYLLDWKERACLRIDELKVLFSNIEDIYEFSSMLLKRLMESTMDPISIAKCFIDMREGFAVYTKYCTSYPEAISLLTKLLQETHTNSLLTSTQKMLQHTLPLGSYLLKPVQRILKYHLLLDNLRKHCDVKEVFQAYEIMRQVARNIDQVKRRLEQQSRVKELSGILDGWLGPELTVLGELRLEGLLMDHNKPRMVFLFATMLIITKPKEDSRLQFKSYIHQNNLMLSEHLPGEPTSFYVIPYDEPRHQIKLTAKNRDQKRVWTQHLKEAMLEKFDNIPSRAKELVYKLGDEEDRTSEKNTWKWTMNSTSMTPVYLERRNQYRRSELRNRFKLKRKSIADLSFTRSCDLKEQQQLPEDECIKPTKPLARKNSLDESTVPMLFRFATIVRDKCLQPTSVAYTDVSQNAETNQSLTGNYCSEHVNTDGQQCSCILTDQRSKTSDAPKLKARSKSVPRINMQATEKTENESPLELPKSLEIKQYNHKTMPTRVSTLKKQKNSNKRDTFKFYMDISEFDVAEEATVLKITESTENLVKPLEPESSEKKLETEHSESLNDNTAQISLKVDCQITEKTKKDAQIVFDLLKDNKEFERIYKKPQRKRSSDLTVQRQANGVENPPPLPSSSPPLLELEAELEKFIQAKAKDNEEHIYETLLRNVHVPYKYSTDFKRTKSVQYYTTRAKDALPPRPESDYVILKYTADGTLQVDESSSEDNNSDEDAQCDKTHSSKPTEESVCSQVINTTSAIKPNDRVEKLQTESSMMSSSSNSLNATNEKELQSVSQKPKGFVRRLLIAKNGYKISSLENISNALLSRAGRFNSNESNTKCSSNSSRPPERRASDVSEMCRIAMLHRQGSEAVGERMAYLDYVTVPYKQGDSFFSLTSSNDSVCGYSKTAKNSSTELSTNFEYEDDVEENLERDFRDSAIYSDDNEKRVEGENEKEKVSNTPLAKPVRSKHSNSIPPKLPPKPPRLKSLPAPHPAVIVCPPHMDQNTSRSWVLQQIENFSK